LKTFKYFDYVEKATLTMGRGYSDNGKGATLAMERATLTIENFQIV
jgi:hypothetical protein